MAVSQVTRRRASNTNDFIDKSFRKSHIPKEHEQAWRKAMDHGESGTSPLRFPIYDHLYQLNITAQRLVQLLREISSGFGIDPEQSLRHQITIQEARSTITRQIVAHMATVEQIDSWQFELQRKQLLKKFEDPDEIYFHVRDREKERIEAGLPPRIVFLDDVAADR